MKLYEIDEQLESVFTNEDGDMIVGATGEVINAEQFEALQMEREEKIENTLLMIKNLKAEADAVKAEADALAKREKALRNKIDSITDFIVGYLNGAKFSTSRVKVSYRHTQAVNVTNLEALTDEYVRIVPEKREADKTAIKNAIKAGIAVDGAVLEDRTALVLK